MLTETTPSAQRVEGAGPAGQRRYRYDVDGLRALAVLLVAGYHVWGAGRVSGGVDIFLMISGFFVGGALVRRVALGPSLDLRRYLPRLARRLVPALALTLAAVVVGVVLLLPQTAWSDASGGVLASLFYVENWRMAIAGQAYAAADPLASPVQHIWSLSVQGQIFLGLPLLLLGLGRGLAARGVLPERRGRTVVVVISLLAAISFAYAVWSVTSNQDVAYYDTFARLWEYLVGTLLAVGLSWVRVRGAAAAALGAAGLALILATGMVVDGRSTFPGLTALVPIGGAALIILAGQHETRGINRLLAWRPIARVGTYAYEFYLWHWVVLVFALAATERAWLGWLAGSTVIVVSAVLAWVTHVLVAPLRDGADFAAPPDLRRQRERSMRLVGLALTVAFVAPLGWFGVRAITPSTALDGVDPARHPGALTLLDADAWPTVAGIAFAPSVLDAGDDWPLRSKAPCPAAGPRDTELAVCELGDPNGGVTVALVGGSHSATFAEPLDAAAVAGGVRILAFLKEGCPLLMFSEPAANDQLESCDRWNASLADELEAAGVDAVITTGTRPGVEIIGWTAGDWVPPWYVNGWGRLTERGVPVLAIRDSPWLDVSAPECVAEFGPQATECGVLRRDALGEDPFAELDPNPLITTIDLSDAFCDAEFCPAVIGNVLVYLDSNHVTATYSRTMTPALERALADVPWWP